MKKFWGILRVALGLHRLRKMDEKINRTFHNIFISFSCFIFFFSTTMYFCLVVATSSSHFYCRPTGTSLLSGSDIWFWSMMLSLSHSLLPLAIKEEAPMLLISSRDGLWAAFAVQAYVKDRVAALENSGPESLDTCVEQYVFYNQQCWVFELLITEFKGFFSVTQQNVYLGADCPQHFSTDIFAVVYRCPDDMDAALKCLAAFMTEQLKSIVIELQLFKLRESDLARCRPTQTMRHIESELPPFLASFQPGFARVLSTTA